MASPRFYSTLKFLGHGGHHCVSHEKNLAILEQLSLDPDHACFV